MIPRRIAIAMVAVSATLAVCWPSSSDAIPAFARKYSLACTACHEAWPKLNDFGRAFKDNGYRLQTGVDEPTDQPAGYWPVSLRTTPGYSYSTLSNQATDEGRRRIRTGGFESPEGDLLAGGTLGPKASFLAIIAGFGEDGTAAFEAAFVRLNNLGGTSWLNLKLGKHEFDLPRSGHRSQTLTQGYLFYSHRPAGDANTLEFDLAENQVGVELSGHDRGSRARYAVSLVTANGAPGSDSFLSSPVVYGHATRRVETGSRLLRQLRVGGFGAIGWSPTRFAADSTGALGAEVAGTGRDNKLHSRAGGELALWFGPLATPVAVTAVAARGSEVSELFADGKHDATWHGGFLLAEATPRLDLALFSRYDWVRNTRQALDDVAKDLGDEDAVTGGLRYTVSYSDRAEVAWHVEFTARRTRRVAADGLDLAAKTFFSGLDFAF